MCYYLNVQFQGQKVNTTGQSKMTSRNTTKSLNYWLEHFVITPLDLLLISF